MAEEQSAARDDGRRETVTFLFTDIEGSTRRWEEDPTGMRAALEVHDQLLRFAIDDHGGTVFKHSGDGMCAVFDSPTRAIEAAIFAQHRLTLPVRMGIVTGEVQPRDGDYFGTAPNRASRVMSAGHGGQILIAGSAADLLDEIPGVELIDLGARQLRDVPEAIRIFQVAADGLRTDFPALITVDVVRGNLPTSATSFVGREAAVAELVSLAHEHRLVTLTGVGGVGKTRLSQRVAADLIPSFPDGVWFVELASVADGGAVPDLVAATLDVTPQSDRSVADSLVTALATKRLLIVFDNCEHVLDAASALVDDLLAHTESVSVIASSREALAIGPEHVWPVPPLDVEAGVASEAAALFMARAVAARPDFDVHDADDLGAVVEICERLDGIALAIELAAARTVSMSVLEVRDRLDDRFRLLARGRRGVERHQTLRQAVQWSYDLLDDDERELLDVCSVFVDGFDLEAVTAVAGSDDEFATLDLMDSLVRKSLAFTETAGHTTRYGLLETMRQFGEDRLQTAGRRDDVAARHAAYYATATLERWAIWDGPRQREALDWTDAEVANLRAAFRWSVDRGDLARATAIAAHAAIMIWPVQRFEPVGWAEEIIDAAERAGVRQLPRLLVAASLCLYLGRPDQGVEYAEWAHELEIDGRHDPFPDGWSGMLEALAHLFAGRIDRRVDICTAMVKRAGLARMLGLCGLTWALPAVDRAEEARDIADETLAAAREYGSPFWIGWALGGFGRAFAATEPVQALEALREGLRYSEEHRLPFWDANMAQDAARLEATHGELDEALVLFGRSIDSFHRAGNVVFLAASMASLAVCLDRLGEHEPAAVIYGASARRASINLVPGLDVAVEQMRSELGEDRFAALVADGGTKDLAEAVRFAHAQIASVASSVQPAVS